MSDLPIRYNSEEINGWQVLQLWGRLDRTTAEEAADEGEKQLAACRKLALDLSGLSYVSSAGLRTILKLASGAEQAGKSIVIISSEGMVREILEMARLDLFITIHDSVDDLKNV
ncbi:STAS domain-containing protein [Selenomonas ruminantium]|uniref:STAS domain-containing protein n=1 Tax=Selenomonas ruminantium TaxID=971 RepID=UPI0026EAD224|nr:STAS domain-containing protein [Selenomonas ruminantium]